MKMQRVGDNGDNLHRGRAFMVLTCKDDQELEFMMDRLNNVHRYKDECSLCSDDGADMSWFIDSTFSGTDLTIFMQCYRESKEALKGSKVELEDDENFPTIEESLDAMQMMIDDSAVQDAVKLANTCDSTEMIANVKKDIEQRMVAAWNKAEIAFDTSDTVNMKFYTAKFESLQRDLNNLNNSEAEIMALEPVTTVTNVELVRLHTHSLPYVAVHLMDMHNTNKEYTVFEDNSGRFYATQYVNGLCSVKKQRMSRTILNGLSIIAREV